MSPFQGNHGGLNFCVSAYAFQGPGVNWLLLHLDAYGVLALHDRLNFCVFAYRFQEPGVSRLLLPWNACGSLALRGQVRLGYRHRRRSLLRETQGPVERVERRFLCLGL